MWWFGFLGRLLVTGRWQFFWHELTDSHDLGEIEIQGDASWRACRCGQKVHGMGWFPR